MMFVLLLYDLAKRIPSPGSDRPRNLAFVKQQQGQPTPRSGFRQYENLFLLWTRQPGRP
jgi:hypothetical protein